MTRYTLTFEVDSIKDPDILDMERDLKSSRQYNPTVRDGIRVMYNLLINDDLMTIFKIERLQNRSSVKDMRHALNILHAAEQGDMEYIFQRYPQLIKEAIQYLGIAGVSQYQPVEQDIETPVVEQKLDREQIFADFIS